VVGAVSYTINSITPPNQPSVSIIKSPYGNFYDISGTFVPLTSSPQYNSTTFAGEIIATNSCGATATLPFTHTVSKPSCGKGKDDVELFPNPADDFVNIKITPKDDEGFELERKIIIQSINEGQKFEKITTEKELQIELGEFENGLYFIQVFRIGEEEPSTATLSILRR
jgi:hypothetical protein